MPGEQVLGGLLAAGLVAARPAGAIDLFDDRKVRDTGFDLIYEARDLDLPQATRDGFTQVRTAQLSVCRRQGLSWCMARYCWAPPFSINLLDYHFWRVVHAGCCVCVLLEGRWLPLLVRTNTLLGGGAVRLLRLSRSAELPPHQ